MKWKRCFSSSFEIVGSKIGGSPCLDWGKNPGYERGGGWVKILINLQTCVTFVDRNPLGDAELYQGREY